jgi:hypothetical protein
VENKNMRGWIKFAALGALLTLPAMAEAQASANASATATVLGQLSASQVRDLDFGDLIPGFGRSIGPSSADAAQFEIAGASGAEVSIGFILPTELADGAETLPITFDGTSAGRGPTAVAVTQTFDPSAPHVTTLPGGTLFVSLGGAVTTVANQAAGDYSATIQLNVSYTGN